MGGQGADHRLCGPNPGTSESCKTIDKGQVCRMVCLFTPQLFLSLQWFQINEIIWFRDIYANVCE